MSITKLFSGIDERDSNASTGADVANAVNALIDFSGAVSDGSANIGGVLASDLAETTVNVVPSLQMESYAYLMNYVVDDLEPDTLLAITSDVPVVTNTNTAEPGVISTLLPLGGDLRSLSWADVGGNRVATAETIIAHRVNVGDKVNVSGSGASYDGLRTVVSVTEFTFSYHLLSSNFPPNPVTEGISYTLNPVFISAQDDIYSYSYPRSAMKVDTTGSAWYRGNTPYNGTNPCYVEFMCHDSQIEIHTSTALVRISVDGIPTTEFAFNVASPRYPGFKSKIEFKNSKSRKIKVELVGVDASFLGTFVRSSSFISKSNSPKLPVCLMIADSFGEGTKAVDRLHSVTQYIGGLMGWNMINGSLGSTGFTTDGVQGVGSKYIDRLARYKKFNPDIVFLWGSVNDGANITEEVSKSIFDKCSAVFPKAKIVTFGPLWPTESVPAGSIISATNLKKASDKQGIKYIDGGIGLTGMPVWINANNKSTYYGGSTASAISTISDSSLSGISVVNNGDGYDPHNPNPIVTITGGGGSGASATAVVTHKVTDIQLLNGGQGYVDPVVVISNGAKAVARKNGFNDQIGFITVIDGGKNYRVPPVVIITGGGGSGATGVSTLSGGRVTGVTLTNAGSGYTSDPTVTLVNFDNQATATATVSNGVITGISIINQGDGYTSSPAVEIIDSTGYGCGAKAIAFISGRVTSVTVTNGGAGYTSPPAISIDSPNGGDTTHPKTNGHQMIAARISAQLFSLR